MRCNCAVQPAGKDIKCPLSHVTTVNSQKRDANFIISLPLWEKTLPSEIKTGCYLGQWISPVFLQIASVLFRSSKGKECLHILLIN